MDQLNQNTQILAITDGSAPKPQQDLHYITDQDINDRSAKEIYYCWLSRLVILFAIISLSFFASASLVLFKLAPEVTVEPFLIIKQDDSDSMVRYEPIKVDMASSTQLMETFVKQYVIMRNTVINDQREMQTRWYGGGVINYLSSDRVFNEFNKDIEAKLTELQKEMIVRDVEIISITKQGGEKSPVWKVDFRTYDLSSANRNEETGNMILVKKYWTASVTAFFVPERMFMAKRLMNPLGFTVTRYSQTEVEIL